jgi:hypothetical protein
MVRYIGKGYQENVDRLSALIKSGALEGKLISGKIFDSETEGITWQCYFCGKQVSDKAQLIEEIKENETARYYLHTTCYAKAKGIYSVE